ncbi:MAG TPA: MBOAT family O-acyltransferase [Bacteroidia bacterium]|nr:MBOAT family O-acyltransferase [Bacteroidia bacterium]
MLFSSLIFLYAFLPFALLGNILIQPRFRNHFLLIVSLIFFAWGGASYAIIFIGSVLMNYLGGLIISKYQDNPKSKKIALVIIITLNIGVLCVFKYLGFLIENLNWVIDIFGKAPLNKPDISLPIGISFYTFHGISYIIDVYRGTTKAQHKLTDLGLYLSFFPQLIAGPIVRYKDVSDQLINRELSASSFNNGIYRFIIGLGKKVLIANTLAMLADSAFKIHPADMEVSMAWLGIIAYTFQLYFDFSGYSDMAIGLALAFGFRFKENFNFPFIAQNMSDFWRRWHISLSTWILDYLYTPLSISTRFWGKFGMIFSLNIAFLLAGLWHGASWNFVIFGILNGVALSYDTLTRKFRKRIASVIPAFIYSRVSIALTFFYWMMCLVFFRANTFAHAIDYFATMFGISGTNHSFFQTLWKGINSEQLVVFLIAIVGSFGMLNFITRFIDDLKAKTPVLILYIADLAKLAFSLYLLVICTEYLIVGTYNPFIYFRF